MINGKYVSIEPIISKVYRDMGMKDAMDINDAIEWAGECLELIAAPYSLVEKVERVPVTNYKAAIPCDLHLFETIAGVQMVNLEDTDYTGVTFKQMLYATDSYHHYYCGSMKDMPCDGTLTYKVNDNFIFTNFEEGQVLVSYQAIPTDDRGYPMIPASVSFKMAVSAYISERLGFIKWSSGKMAAGVYQKLDQERMFYIGQAGTSGQLTSLDQMQAIQNNMLRLIPKINQHSDGFKSQNEPEQRYIK